MINAPSDSLLNYELIFQWIFVLLALLGLLYAAIIIKNEKITYKENAISLKFQELMLDIPNWWSVDKVGESKFHFKRADTRYSWSGKFSFEATTMNTTEYLEQYLITQEIELDNSYESYELITKPEFLFKDIRVQKLANDFLRVESVGTEKETDRIYLDLCLLKTSENNIYVFESKSSVLNGCVEGPYFEECLKTAEVS